MSRLLVRRPSPRLADGELTHLGRTSVDAELALRQWEAYVDVFRTRGWEIIEIAPADEQPDGVFVEDAVVVFGDLAVLCRAGALSRRGEASSVRDAIAGTGLEVAEIVDPGTLDGGDVLKIGSTVYVGASSRTNADGIAQLTALLAPRGHEVIAVPVERVLHLKSGVTALPDGTVVGFEPLVDDPSLFPAFAAVPEEHGTAVVVLAPGEVLLSSDAPETAAAHAARGLTVVTTPISEFEKLEGCVTCLSVRVRD
ncbi:dimethylargininase [Microbacterium dextranolyticum]|uniref:N(G),N(G)-dimethylarginine dimethylaminohydrolase n=1 Tax=Microbacterium dextranolyticum TaxID=36806 RepID=A0A9W6HND0_9MICO|nr:dimethylargininase [Microbacterium dextranolyticum]MBM7463291.1 dimethylargininase [Microbacterium dextranolyticum]GLJ95604.1 N(G),N(G)-dimethylarginine dimethylaminohydrolase [Microbacterium dextranolyticum]